MDQGADVRGAQGLAVGAMVLDGAAALDIKLDTMDASCANCEGDKLDVSAIRGFVVKCRKKTR